MKTPVQEIEEALKAVDLHPSLEEAVKASGLNLAKLDRRFEARDDKPDLSARDEVMITDGTKGAI